jgi:hypothetical protein
MKEAPPFPINALPEYIQADVKKFSYICECDISDLCVCYVAAAWRVMSDRNLGVVVGGKHVPIGRNNMFETIAKTNGTQEFVERIEKYLRSPESPLPPQNGDVKCVTCTKEAEKILTEFDI